MPNRAEFEEKLRAVVKQGDTVDKDAIRRHIYSTFEDEAVSLRLRTIGILKGKINLICNLMTIASGMSDALTNTEEGGISLEDEFKDEPLADKVKMLKDITDTIMRLSASAKQIEEMSHALNDLEKALVIDAGDTTKRKLFKDAFMELEGILINNSDIEDIEIIKDKEE